MKKVVITGATGMIAVALIKYLIEKEIEVIAICRPNSSKLKNVPKHKLVRIVECDITDLIGLKDYLNEKYDAFFHFAWNGTFGNSRNDSYLQNMNVKYTLDAVNLASHLGCEVFVGAGSQAEYGRVEGKLSSATPTDPENGYGIAKYTAGKLSAIYAKQLNIKHVWARILSVYGPNDNNFTMIMSTIEKLLNGERASFTKGEQEWDYLYCDDAAKAIYLMALYGKDQAVYPLGSGIHRPLSEYITILREEIPRDCEIGLGDIPYSDNQVMYLCADISELTKDTGFVPTMSFREGIKKTIQYKQNSL